MSAIDDRPRKTDPRPGPVRFRVADPKATTDKFAEAAFLADETRGEVLERLIDAELERLRKKTGWPGRVAV